MYQNDLQKGLNMISFAICNDESPSFWRVLKQREVPPTKMQNISITIKSISMRNSRCFSASSKFFIEKNYKKIIWMLFCWLFHKHFLRFWKENPLRKSFLNFIPMNWNWTDFSPEWTDPFQIRSSFLKKDLDPTKIQEKWSAIRIGNCCVQFLTMYELKCQKLQFLLLVLAYLGLKLVPSR